MARKRFHGLKKVKIRATWNKYNLYNLSRLRTPMTSFQTYYQQKWGAKSMTRAYHGEQIREKQWQRMFTPHLNSVIPMDHKYLAEHDGSELARGRGSGLEKKLDLKEIRFGMNSIPYMHMTYAPLERRLDMAVWRALFASSARQARQFVIHGNVKVNGKKMPYPGYLLNPGDMFQVEVDRVMFATGEQKQGWQARQAREIRRKRRRINVSLDKQRAQSAEKGALNAAAKAEKRAAEAEASNSRPFIPKGKTQKTQTLFEDDARAQRKVEIQALMVEAQNLQNDKVNRPGAKRKRDLRAWTRNAKLLLSQLQRRSADELDHNVGVLYGQLERIKKGVYGLGRGKEKEKDKPKVEAEEEAPKKTRKPRPEDYYSLRKLRLFREGLVEARENPEDETKPYATPWRPRPYMSAFAFVPRYLEVNPNICAAVYLRHPVARPGLSEVPSPFPAEMQQLAFNWYLRRR